MKPFLPLLAATFGGLVAGCADWSYGAGHQPQYTPMHGGPGYGPQAPLARYNAAPEGHAPVDTPANGDEWSYPGAGSYMQSTGASDGDSTMTGTGTSGTPGATGNAAGAASGSSGTGSSQVSESSGMAGAGAAGAAATGAPLDQQSMCELQRRVSAAHTPEERQALLEQAMPGMTPETQERHLQMMRQSCQ